MPTRSELGFEHAIRIESTPPRVLAAFFEPAALEAWWDVAVAVATPRPLGAYALEWHESDVVDELLGRLGGVFHGMVIDFQPGRGFFVADAYWLPPEGDPIGPMAMEVTCTPADKPAGRPTAPAATTLRVVLRGLDDSPRWIRYYEVIGAGLTASLETLKHYLEHGKGAWDLRHYA
jgi:uncharacterized protein YndB with AHSA1/START domain